MSPIDPHPDHQLLQRTEAGDAQAFAQLYQRHQAPLYRFALLRSGSADTAADIVQEVFLSLFTQRLQFDPTRGALLSFLFGVARNLMLKRETASQRFISTPPNDEATDEDALLIDDSPGPAEVLFANRDIERVRQALAQLAPHYRDVLILYEMHELSYLDIAKVCQIDIGTVRSRLSRARALMAKQLQDLSPHARQPAANEATL
ncbi:MAG: RNA polymerase sigma factor [Betaproteobacteria bacterium]|nr:RNA polymerase sigma factor [Betaproteobacteria bacterium]